MHNVKELREEMVPSTGSGPRGSACSGQGREMDGPTSKQRCGLCTPVRPILCSKHSFRPSQNFVPEGGVSQRTLTVPGRSTSTVKGPALSSTSRTSLGSPPPQPRGSHRAHRPRGDSSGPCCSRGLVWRLCLPTNPRVHPQFPTTPQLFHRRQTRGGIRDQREDTQESMESQAQVLSQKAPAPPPEWLLS